MFVSGCFKLFQLFSGHVEVAAVFSGHIQLFFRFFSSLRIVFSFCHGNALTRSRVHVCAHLNATVVSPFVHSVTPSVQRIEC